MEINNMEKKETKWSSEIKEWKIAKETIKETD